MSEFLSKKLNAAEIVKVKVLPRVLYGILRASSCCRELKERMFEQLSSSFNHQYNKKHAN